MGMDREVLKIVLKEIVVAFLIIALAFGIELIGFNYHTFVKGETTEILIINRAEKCRKNWEAVEKSMIVSVCC